MKKIVVSALAVAFTQLFSAQAFSQKDSLKIKYNWYNLDYEIDGVRGMSVEKTYNELLKGRTSKTVLVGVIDSGIDTKHEDLASKIWINTKEIAGNGKDDDGNGFIDDINGWDFLGGKDGRDIAHEQVETTRILKELKTKFGENPSKRMIRKNKKDYELMQKLQTEVDAKLAEAKQSAPFYKQIYQNLLDAEVILKDYLKVSKLTPDLVKNIDDSQVERNVRAAKQMALRVYDLGASSEDLKEAVDQFDGQIEYNYNLDYNPRKEIIGDDVKKTQYGTYGNNEVRGTDAMHGTHVAGIIGADRNNNLGVKGVCDNVQIMVIRAVPDGDERDKDVANAIRYATDNGVRVLNMSFGKKLSPEKKFVDEAVKYALSKGVLLVAAAGNDADNMDTNPQFPNDKYENGTFAENWISVGALSWKSEPNIVADFSNYGHVSVDVFAPGVDLFSTVPDSKYKELSGTSMASPAVCGVAALLISYFPELTAAQVKKIIIESSVKMPTLQVNKPGAKELINFGDLSVTGGVVNAYNAVKMAIEMTEKK
jgi:subtilisin family serine protease